MADSDGNELGWRSEKQFSDSNFERSIYGSHSKKPKELGVDI